MRTYSRATLIGHVGNDVVLRRTASGKPVVNLSVATSLRRKEGEESTVWHRVVLWDRLAELCEKYVTRGQALYIEGPITTRDWVDSDGVQRQKTEIVARELIFMPRGASGHEASPADVVHRSGNQAPDGEELAEVRAEVPF